MKPDRRVAAVSGDGIRVDISATVFAPIEQLQLMRFEGERWVLFGDVIGGELSN